MENLRLELLLEAQRSNLCANPLAGDLDHILTYTKSLWKDLKCKRLFITGGTGFFGCWLLESLIWANNQLGLNASALVLTRDYDGFQKRVQHIASNPAIQFHIGDIRNFDFPEGEFSHVIHAAATSASATFYGEEPLVKFDTVVEGTRHTLDFAAQCNAKKFLMTSSGAVYGKQPLDMTYIPEDYCGGPDLTNPNSVWGESKRAAELLCTLYSKKYGIEMKIARCFVFVGPYLPLNIHYAIGNFIRDGLEGGPIIHVKGDGTPYRSYLYAADLAIWLWMILLRGASGETYNVGSDTAISIKDLGYEVSSAFSHSPSVTIAENSASGQPVERYVPSIKKARKRLGLDCWIDLKEALRRTIKWNENLRANMNRGVFGK